MQFWVDKVIPLTLRLAYTYVPRSKTMTQQKRNKVQTVMEFNEEDDLPCGEW